jgi:two-component system, NtrC family, sensor histidine kinase PilS
MLRWVWLGRLVLACAILVAAVVVWNRAAPRDTLVATLSFAVAVLATVASAMYGEIDRRPPGAFYYGLQCTVDLLLVTAIVHVTGGWSSQFAALYILVIASGALLLPFRGTVAVAAGACAFYTLDVLWLRPGASYLGVGIQLAVFGIVGIGAGFIASRLRQAGVGRAALAAQLVTVQLEAADILRTIRSGILTIDAQGRLLYANPAASELLGVDLRTFTSGPVLDTIHGIAPQLATVLAATARDRVRTTRAEGIIHRERGDIEIGVTTTVADDPRPDGGVSATAIFQDISDSKRVQQLHVRAERLQAVAELSASLAHEIRNPLASIRSATEQLARRRAARADEQDDDERVLHGLVVREADRLSRLLADFLDFARARLTRVATLNIGAVVHTAAMLAASHPDRRTGVDVQVDIGEDLPLIDGDEDLVHRAVFNLVLNAVQAVEENGHVFVDVHRHASTDPRSPVTPLDGELLAISVTDDGPGIPPELRTRLFEPFVTGKAGGSGLGLPVVHRAVEAHRGTVVVDSLARGTRFTILLPVAGSGSAPTPNLEARPLTALTPIDAAVDPQGASRAASLFGVTA